MLYYLPLTEMTRLGERGWGREALSGVYMFGSVRRITYDRKIVTLLPRLATKLHFHVNCAKNLFALSTSMTAL